MSWMRDSNCSFVSQGKCVLNDLPSLEGEPIRSRQTPRHPWISPSVKNSRVFRPLDSIFCLFEATRGDHCVREAIIVLFNHSSIALLSPMDAWAKSKPLRSRLRM